MTLRAVETMLEARTSQLYHFYCFTRSQGTISNNFKQALNITTFSKSNIFFASLNTFFNTLGTGLKAPFGATTFGASHTRHQQQCDDSNQHGGHDFFHLRLPVAYQISIFLMTHPEFQHQINNINFLSKTALHMIKRRFHVPSRTGRPSVCQAFLFSV